MKTDAGAYHTVTYTGFYDATRRPVRGVVPAERVVTLYTNGQPLVSITCTPTYLKELALGFLFNEGLIEGWDDVAVVEVCGGGKCVDVWLEHDIELSPLRVITSGCSGGTTFDSMASTQRRIESEQRVTPRQVTQLMGELSHQAALYHRSGGVHTAALSDGERLTCVMEDVGRHNALDKLAGKCLRERGQTDSYILLTSGRVSSEMVQKAARMEIPIVISRTSPTSLSVQLAEAWGVTLIGYTRRRSFRVYTGEERVVGRDQGGERGAV